MSKFHPPRVAIVGATGAVSVRLVEDAVTNHLPMPMEGAAA